MTGSLQLPHLPGDMGCLHGEQLGQFPQPQRLRVGQPAQQCHRRPVELHARQRRQHGVPPGTGVQLGGTGEGPLDLDRFR